MVQSFSSLCAPLFHFGALNSGTNLSGDGSQHELRLLGLEVRGWFSQTKYQTVIAGDRRVGADTKLKMSEVVKDAEKLVHSVMGKWDASHDAFHALRVRKLALTLAAEEQLSPESMEIVELASLLHDVGDHKYASDESECKVVERFLESHGVEFVKRDKILSIINRMGFKDELAGVTTCEFVPEFGVVQDADRLDAIGAIGIARCLTFGGSRNRVLHDPEVKARINLSKEEYTKQDGKQTTLNHFHEKLLKLKDLMKTEAGRRRAEKRHKFMQDFLTEFMKNGRATCDAEFPFSCL